MSLDPTRVGQLKKLYTTSCVAVISWSSSSINTTLLTGQPVGHSIRRETRRSEEGDVSIVKSTNQACPPGPALTLDAKCCESCLSDSFELILRRPSVAMSRPDKASQSRLYAAEGSGIFRPLIST